MIRLPLAGNVLAFAQYLRGLELLGYDVHYVEESGWDDSCYDPHNACYTSCPHVGMKMIRELLDAIGCSCPLYYVDSQQQVAFGRDREEIEQAVLSADLVLNIGGVNWLDEFERAKRLTLIDMDPMFTQVGSFAKEGIGKYDAYFTYGTNIGAQECSVPVGDINWYPAVPPVVPELWADLPADGDAHVFSTIANWSAYGGIDWQGEHYGQKDQQFLKLIDLPKRVPAKLRLAVTGMPAKIAAQFCEHGWEIVDGQQASLCLKNYLEFIATSSGEFSVAKQGYVKARTGWVSDRTVCYLAAGRPAVVQDTCVMGSISRLPGWHSFRTIDEAAEGICRVVSNYGEEKRLAQSLARSVFAYDVVLPPLIERAMAAA